MNSFFQIREFEFELERLDHEYKLMQISDLHFNQADKQSSENDILIAKRTKEKWDELRIDFAKEFNDSYSKEHLIDTDGYFQLFIDLANQLKPDALLCSGDMMEEYTDSTARYLEEMVKKIEVPFIFSKGNHDTLDKPIYYKLSNGDYDYQRVDIGQLRIISIDNSQYTISKHCLIELEKDLSSDKVPILLMHVPIKSEENRAYLDKLDPYFFIEDGKCDNDTQDFLEVLKRKDKPIKLVLCGHLHGCLLNQLYPGVDQLVCSSGLVGNVNIISLKPKK